MIEVTAEDEEDFVEKTLTTPRPCTIWMKGDFDRNKIDEIAKRRGIFFVNNYTHIERNEGTICLPNLSSDRELDLKSLPTALQEKVSTTQTQLQQQSDEKSTETKK